VWRIGIYLSGMCRSIQSLGGGIDFDRFDKEEDMHDKVNRLSQTGNKIKVLLAAHMHIEFEYISQKKK
jgi:hypothetical protein